MSGELETVALKAMARNPEERYATARELADDLRRFLEDRPVLARGPGPVARLRKFARRHRTVLATLAAACALAVAGLFYGAVDFAQKQGKLAEDRHNLAEDTKTKLRKAQQELYRPRLVLQRRGHML